MKGPPKILVSLLLLFMLADSFPRCDDGDTTLEETCDVFGDQPLTWNPISVGYLYACFQDASCNGNLAGVRCVSGDGFTSCRYNRWECLESCTVPSDIEGNATRQRA